jgi:cation:H+ antiporter
MIWIALSLIVGAIMLYFGSEWLVRGGKGLALRLGVTPFVIGLTVLAFGSSAPEAITSIVSTDTPDIIIGNVVGSNIANVGLAIGIAAIVGPMAAKYNSMRIEIITMLIASVGLFILGFFNFINWIEGIILISLLFVFLFFVFKKKSNDEEGQEAYVEEVTPETLSTPILIILVVVGLVALYFGARFFIDGARDLAVLIGVPDLIIGLIVVAIGTSLPELCISVLAARRGEADMAVANIVGSNIFNIMFVLGIGSLLVDVPVSESVLYFHLPVMLLLSVVMFLMVRFRNKIDRMSGVLLVGIYMGYIAVIALVPGLMI